MKRPGFFTYLLLLTIAAVVVVNASDIFFQQKNVFAADSSGESLSSVAKDSSTLSDKTAYLPQHEMSRFKSLADAVALIGKEEAVLVIAAEQAAHGQILFPANIELKFQQNGRLNIAAGATVHIKGAISAGLQQIFAGSGTVSFVDGSSRQVYPQWWGAKGNGKSDDTIPVQATISAIAKRGGGEVIFTDGVYVVNSLSLDSNVALTGKGWTSIIEQKKGAQFGCSVNPWNAGTPRSSDNKRNIRIANIQFRGTVKSDGFAEHQHLLNINAASDVVISGCRFTGWRGDGIYLGSSNVGRTERHNRNITIRNCFFDGVNNDNRNAISVIDCDGLIIDNNSFSRCTRPNMPGAIDMEPNDDKFPVIRNISITNNRFEEIGGNVGIISLVLAVKQNDLHFASRNILIDNNTMSGLVGAKRSNGITLKQNQNADDATIPNDITISNNKIHNSARPFVILGVKGVTVRGNVFDNASISALVSYSEGFRCQDIVFTGNTFKELGNYDGVGIIIFNVNKIDFTDNTFDNIGLPNGTYGVVLDFHNGTVDRVRIENNRFKGKRTTIAMLREANNVNFPEHNTIRNNTYEKNYAIHLPAKR